MFSSAFEETNKVDDAHKEGKHSEAHPEQTDGEKVYKEYDRPE